MKIIYSIPMIIVGMLFSSSLSPYTMRLIDPYLVSRIKANLRPLIFNIYLRITLSIWFCQKVVRSIVYSVDHELFNAVRNTFWGITTAIVVLLIFIVDRKQSKRKERKIYYLPTSIFAIAAICLSVILYQLGQRDKSPVKLHCVTKICDFNGMAYDFREDGTYTHIMWSIGAEYYRGTYTISDSIITMRGMENDKTIKRRMLIRPGIEIYEGDSIRGNDTNHITSVYEINDSGRIIPNAYDYVVR